MNDDDTPTCPTCAGRGCALCGGTGDHTDWEERCARM